MPFVRTTIRPDRELHVGDREYEQLAAQGLLVDSTKPRPEDAGAAPAGRRRPPQTTPTKET